MKEKLLQVKQRCAKSKHDFAMKVIEAEKLKVELNSAWAWLDEAGSSTIEAERCIESIREDICEASLVQSELEECVAELIEGAKVASKKVVKEYKTFEAFKEEVTEGALGMFLFGFDEC